MSSLLALPVAMPLLGAGASMALHRRPRAQRVLGVAVLVATLAVSVAVLAQVESDGVVSADLGDWPAPVGITLVADLFSAIMLVVGAVMVLGVLLYAIGQPGTRDEDTWFHPVYLVLAAGVSASFLTGDLFNLFVAFEVMLSASYVLLTLGGRLDQVRTGMTYVVISLLTSLLFITGVGLVYAATGTVNMAQLASRVQELPEGLQLSLSALFLVVFGIKAGLFPLFFWLPDSYPTAPTPISAVFAGLLTKVGVYAIIRSQTLFFPGERISVLILVVAAATMLVGVLGALAQDDIKRILSFHIVSQIGYMIFALGLFTVAGLAGGIFYIVHHIVVKTSLFLAGGLVEQARGTGRLRELGGLLHRAPVVAVVFALPALSLAGLPPFSGFLAKLALVRSGIDAGALTVVAISLLVSLLTLLSMTKIWTRAFWGEPPQDDGGAGGQAADDGPARLPRAMVASAMGLVAITLTVAAAGQPIYTLAERAAVDLLDPSQYVDEVLGP